ncbi:MAG: hypothetical protein WAQ08_04495 [Aquabacterium sp.]|uniref:hypothetical protein n=1 Tax=Aquabacterium sp. TaxID=1872578 RepID=UPI003BB1A72B
MNTHVYSSSLVPSHARAMVSAVLTATTVALTIAVLLVLAPGAIDTGHLIAFIEEDGPLEVATVVVWMIAAVYLLLPGRRPRLTALPFAVFCFAMGMRENGLPPDLVPHGRRLVQLGFYLHGPESLTYRIVAGLVVLAAAVHVMIFLAREFFQRRGWVEADTGMFILAMVVLVMAQIAESVLDHPAWMLTLFPEGWSGQLSLESLEEGLEAVGAFYVLVAAHLSRQLGRERRRFG